MKRTQHRILWFDVASLAHHLYDSANHPERATNKIYGASRRVFHRCKSVEIQFLVLAFSLFSTTCAFALEKYIVIPDLSKIKGSIKYSVVGTYDARFEDFSGDILFDPENILNSSVNLAIQVKSVKSKFPVLDRIVRSKKMLDAAQYPQITFNSTKIEKFKDHYLVTGKVHLHGIKKEITFPFYWEGIKKADQKIIVARGQWKINRKDFEIIWNKVLDQGGIVVGNHVLVDWKIVAKQRSKEK